MSYNLHTLESGSVLYYGSAKFKSMNTVRRMFGEAQIKFPSDINFFISNKETALTYTSPYEDPEEYFGSNPPVTINEENLHSYVTKRISKYIIFNDPKNIEMLLYGDPHSPFNYENRREYVLHGTGQISNLTTGNNRRAILKYLRDRNDRLKHPELEDATNIPDDINRSMFGILLLATGIYRGQVRRDSSYAYDFQIANLFKDYFKQKDIDGWWQPKEVEFHEEYCIFTPEDVIDYVAPTDAIPRLRMYIDKLDKGTREFPSRDELLRAHLDIRKSVSRDHGCHIASVCDNPLTFEKEGQDALNSIYEEMLQYPNASNIHHTGKTIADHSIWVTRTIYNWLAYQAEPWTANIWPEFRETTLLSAFLHDIGKIGDLDVETLVEKGEKPEHPLIGYRYLTGERDFRSLRKTCKNFIECYGLKIPNSVFPVIASVVALHHHFGELLVKYSMYRVTPSGVEDIKSKFDLHAYNGHGRSFISSILGCIVELKYIIVLHNIFKILKLHDKERIFLDNKDNLEQLLLILCAVGAADTFGSYTVMTSRERSRYSPIVADVLDPQVIFRETASSRDSLEIYRPYYKFAYGTLGLAERDKLIEYSRLIVDYDALCAAWDGFQTYIRCITHNRMGDVPDIYRTLPTDTPNKYLTALLRLLKVGSTDILTTRVQRYQPRDIRIQAAEGDANPSWRKSISEYLMSDSENLSKTQMALLEKFRNHRIDILRPGEQPLVQPQPEQQQQYQKPQPTAQTPPQRRQQRPPSTTTELDILLVNAQKGNITDAELRVLVDKAGINMVPLTSPFVKKALIKQVLKKLTAS